MGFYGGLAYLKKKGVLGRVEYAALSQPGYMVRNSVGKLVMRVNKFDSIDEQVKTVIHECWHCSPEFIRYCGSNRIEWVERELDRRTEITYQNNPLLVECLRDAVINHEDVSENISNLVERLKSERKNRIWDAKHQGKFDFMNEK